MSSRQIITDHDLWRQGTGGAPAGLDLNLAQFASSSFSGTRFSDTTFQQAGWTRCTFGG